MSTYYLFLDTETGGLDAKNTSLLSVSFLLTDADGKDCGGLHLYLRPDDGVYKLTPDALRLNQIDVTDQEGVVTYVEGHRLLESFLSAFTGKLEKAYIIPVGWNVPFDLDFIYNQLVPKQTFQKWLNSYKVIDIASVWLYLKAIGKVNSKRDRLIDAVEVLGLAHGHVAHDAGSDTLATKNVFFALKDKLL